MSISDQIIAIINDLCEKLGIAIDWSADNILPKVEALCAKYIRYEIWTSVAWIALWCGITLLLWIIASVMVHKERKKDELDRWDFDCGVMPYVTVIMIIAAAISSFITLCVVGTQIFDIVEAKVFPEKTIYEFVSSKLQELKN
jgi:hypothetical protein